MKKQIKKNLVNGFLVLATVGTLGTVGVNHVMAYLTDTESTTNTFTVGKVQIDLEEADFPTTGVTHIVPNQVIAKNPKVENTGANEAICFVTVSVPTKNVITAADNGTRNGAAMTELFKTQSGNDPYGYGASNSKWALIDTKYVKEDGGSETTMTANTVSVVRTYGYTTKLGAGETTDTVFDNVKFANIVEGQVALDAEENIEVKAAAIQATDIATIDTNDLNDTTLKNIYGVYLNQADGTQDKDANTSNAKDLKGNNRA